MRRFDTIASGAPGVPEVAHGTSPRPALRRPHGGVANLRTNRLAVAAMWMRLRPAEAGSPEKGVRVEVIVLSPRVFSFGMMLTRLEANPLS